MTSDQAIKPGLEAIREALYCLGNPHQQLRVVHIAGTNGKGSTLAFIARIARQYGLNVGTFMSPCVVDVHDQIQVNGEPITEQQLDILFQVLQQAGLSGKLTDFELLTVLAFLHFQREQVDIVVLETGMGGLLDSTNVVTPIVSVITSIALEHTQFLGDTLTEIAQHKAGIIKQGKPVVVGRLETEAAQVIEQRAFNKQAPLLLLGKTFDIVRYEQTETYVNDDTTYVVHDLRRQMRGPHQADNMALAVTAFIEVARVLHIPLSAEAIRQGVERATLAGRFEEVLPNVFFDGAHNPASAEKLVATIREQFPNRPVQFVIGMLADKDVQAVLTILQQVSDDFVFVDFDYIRAMKADKMIALCSATHKQIVRDAVQWIRKGHEQEKILVVTGSLYLLASLREALYSE